MTDILAKNLSFIKKYNNSLCEKILAVDTITKDIQLNTNLAGEYNILIDGMAVHSVAGAQSEAKEIVKNIPHNSRNSIHVIYGLGLGYLYDEFVQNNSGSIIVYEPNIELLRMVLEIVDFSESFSKENSYFVSDYTEYRSVFEHVLRYRSRVSLSVLDFYKIHYKEDFEFFKKEVFRLFSMYDQNYSFQVNRIVSFLKHTAYNLDKKLECPLLTDYKDLLKGKPAVIVSAGPSLAKNIDVLKKYRDEVYIFCVGTALKTLLKNGIIPDFLHVIETLNTVVHYNVPETKDMILVCEPYTNSTIFDFPFRKIFVTASQETDAGRWFMDMAGKEPVEFETKGTVSYHALYSAMYLGCNPIILIGQDLAYSDGNCYAKGSAFEDLQCIFDEKLNKYRIYPKNFEKYRDAYYAPLTNLSNEEKDALLNKALQKFNAELVTVDGQDGKKLPTSAAYSLFIEYIKEFAKKYNNEKKLLNCSTGGAQIDGFENTTLENALSMHCSGVIDKEQVLKCDDFKADININQAKDNIKREISLMQTLLPIYKDGYKFIERTQKELNLRKTYTQDAKKNMSKASELYVQLTNRITSQSKLLRMLSLKEHSEIAYLMKENTLGSNLDFETASEFCEAFVEYYTRVEKKFRWFIYVLGLVVENLEKINNESSSTKS